MFFYFIEGFGYEELSVLVVVSLFIGGEVWLNFKIVVFYYNSLVNMFKLKIELKFGLILSI